MYSDKVHTGQTYMLEVGPRFPENYYLYISNHSWLREIMGRGYMWENILKRILGYAPTSCTQNIGDILK